MTTKAIVEVLLDAGFSAIEIPLNSPDPFSSIKIAAELAKNHSTNPCLVGAGTVLSAQDVTLVHKAGGNLIVSPNVNLDVIKQAKELEMLSAPGVYTPSECLSALERDADILKIFPAANMGPSGIKALSAILPKGSQLCAVGGIGNDDFGNYLKAGATGFGLGSSLYSESMSVDDVRQKAIQTMQAYQYASV